LRYLFIIIFSFAISNHSVLASNKDSLEVINLNDTLNKTETLSLLDSARYYEKTDIKKSISLAKETLKNAFILKNDSVIIEAKLFLSSHYIRIGLYDNALEYLQDAKKHYEEENNDKGQTSILQKIGDLLWYSGKFKDALSYYEDFGRNSLKNNDTISYIRSQIAKGAVYGNINRLDTAILIFKSALEHSESINNKYLINLCKFNIGDALLFSDRPYQAITIFLELVEELKNNKKDFSNFAGLYSSLANAHIKINQPKTARKYNKIAFEFALKDSLLTELSTYYDLEFQIDTSLKDYKKALFNHIKYKTLSDSINTKKNIKKLANFQLYYDLRKREIEIEKLKLENEIGHNQLKRNRYFLFSGTIVLLLLLALFINIYRSKKELNKKNKRLDEQKEELESTLDQLKDAQAQLVQSEKMASLGILTTGIAHEINNPLNYINGGIHILEDVRDEFNEEDIEETKNKFNLALKMVEDGFKKTSTIVKSLMSFATRENNELEKHSITTMLNNTLTFLTPRLENISIEKNCIESDELLVYPDKLHQVFLNIFDNAIKALAKVDDKKIKVATYKNNHTYSISIQNNGPQIAKKHLDKLFDPFFTTRETGKGVGMGLTISYNLIKEHNGEIKVRNLKEGVEFIIELPLT